MPKANPGRHPIQLVQITATAHKILKAAAAAHDIPVEDWLGAAIANQAEIEGLDIESVLAIQEELG